MRRGSRLWPLAAALIAGGAVLEAAAVMLYWRPCAGQSVTGGVDQDYEYASDFREACLAAMDRAELFQLPQPGAGWTLTGSLGAGAAVLLALAWLVLLPVLRVPVQVRLLAALPGVLALALVANSVAMSLAGPLAEDGLGNGLRVVGELSVGVAMIAIAAAGVKGLLLARYAIVALAATSPGPVHQVADYTVSIMASGADWDVPPAGGSLIVALCLVTAVATLAGWRLDRSSRATSLPAAVSAPVTA